MLVPRSYKYTSPPAPASDGLTENARRSPAYRRKPPTRHSIPRRTCTEPVNIPTTTTTTITKLPDAQAPESAQSGETATQTMPTTTTTTQGNAALNCSGRRKTSSSHDPNALPPAVAALLAITAIPPRRPNRYRTSRSSHHRMSIDELVRDWKSDETLKSSYGSSPALNILLEDHEDGLFDDGEHKGSPTEPAYLNMRSASSESMPSLESDDHSVLSVGSPSTPGSLRSRKSYQTLRREKPRSLSAVQDCHMDHPLAPRSEPDEDGLLLPTQKKSLSVTRARSSFKSNLTTSLQLLKNAAVNSISSLGRGGGHGPSLTRENAAPLDDMLWSHPFLFPRFSSEIRPATSDLLPSSAERRYLNPIPLTFEEQEAPFQQALHAPFLAEPVTDAPTIQMQTYNRGRKRGGASSRRGTPPNPSSEAGRALLGSVRQREVRENSDFLRVVVLEMNMRRDGKLEQGRARIWLPPREVISRGSEVAEKVPRRWVGESAY